MSNQHWCLVCIDLARWTMSIYDSFLEVCMISRNEILFFLNNFFSQWLLCSDHDYGGIFRPPPFERLFPDQLGTIGDCGVWVCIFLRLINGESLSSPGEDPRKNAYEFRWSFAELMYENKIRLETAS
ncbi:hypothetical protein R6Q59_006145 [Mikania micrantha]